MKQKQLIVFFLFCLLSIGCHHNTHQEELSSIQIHDRNGFQETISNEERLRKFSGNDFLSPQPYQKVTRVYRKGKEGFAKAIATSYHDNGQIKQLLEILNGRAWGKYIEWHENGQKKIEAYVIEGIGDLSPDAGLTWIFDGKSTAWDAEGHLLAEISYEKGKLHGYSLYYHENGEIHKRIPYKDGVIHGVAEEFGNQGEPLEIAEWSQGKRQGFHKHFQNLHHPYFTKRYQDDRLIEAEYFDSSGNLVSKVRAGNGVESIFDEEELIMQREVQNGEIQGKVTNYRLGKIASQYRLLQEDKHGEEVLYYEGKEQIHQVIPWNEGRIHGIAKSFYLSGQLESKREYQNNIKHGHSFAWYPSGDLMLAEEYSKGKLVKGKYFRKGSDTPESRIEQGSGIASLFDQDGSLIEKVEYEDGDPIAE